MKIVYMGTPDFAVAPLEALLAAGHTVTAVVTQPDKPKGRSGKLQMSPVKECALQHDIPVLQPIKIKRAEEIERLRQYEADVYVVAAFGQIFSQEILDLPPYGSLCIMPLCFPPIAGHHDQSCNYGRTEKERRDDHADGRRIDTGEHPDTVGSCN